MVLFLQAVRRQGHALSFVVCKLQLQSIVCARPALQAESDRAGEGSYGKVSKKKVSSIMHTCTQRIQLQSRTGGGSLLQAIDLQ